MNVREDLYYTKEHAWIKVEGSKAYIGITDYAQSQLGDIVFIELPQVDDEFAADERLGVIESVKAVADLLSPIKGIILEINEDLEGEPELLNQDAYENWIVALEIADMREVENLLTPEAYRELLALVGE